MKHTSVEVNDDFLSAKIVAFKELCMTEGDYKLKTGSDDETKINDNRGVGLGGR